MYNSIFLESLVSQIDEFQTGSNSTLIYFVVLKHSHEEKFSIRFFHHFQNFLIANCIYGNIYYLYIHQQRSIILQSMISIDISLKTLNVTGIIHT